MSERLYRDDAQSALERVARLEEENEALRQEVARLKNRGAPTVRVPRMPPRPSRAVAVLVSLTGVLVGGLMASVVAARAQAPVTSEAELTAVPVRLAETSFEPKAIQPRFKADPPPDRSGAERF